MKLRWAIVGAGRISHDFVTALQIFPENHVVVAIASKSKENAEKFAKDHNIPKWYDNYQKIADEKYIDVVYVGNLNTEHYDVTKMLLENGKPVLCEKPFTMNEKNTTELYELAKSKDLFLMEAVWSRCFPAYLELRKLLDNCEIGEVLYVNINFGFPLQNVKRLTSKDFGGGAILDLGIYVLQFQQFVFRGLKPAKVVAHGHLNSDFTDESAAAIITYPNGKMAIVGISARVDLSNEAVIVGTKGTIKVPNFWAPTELIINDKELKFTLPKTTVPCMYFNSAGLIYEADEVRLCLLKGKIESEHMPHKESIELAKLMDTMRNAVGVHFPQDV